ncbi:MAG: response regulator [Anaerolineales bacterium]|nr:response regulator [Anaerolineales bacterium]
MANILLVDDDPVLLALLGKLLRRLGHAVTAADGGRAGLAAAREPGGPAFDLVLTDLRMPDLDGYDLIRALRTEGATAAAVILLVSSHLEGPDPELARAAGADAWAAKPLHAERLGGLIQRLLAGQPAAAPAEGL